MKVRGPFPAGCQAEIGAMADDPLPRRPDGLAQDTPTAAGNNHTARASSGRGLDRQQGRTGVIHQKPGGTADTAFRRLGNARRRPRCRSAQKRVIERRLKTGYARLPRGLGDEPRDQRLVETGADA